MNIDSFTDEQLLNHVNNTILDKTEFNPSDFTGGAIQTTSTHKNKITVNKVVILFGYDKNNNSRSWQQEISKDTYFIWAKALLLKVESLIVNNVGSEINDLNRMMSKNSKKSSSIDNKIEIVDNKIVDSQLTNNSKSIVLMTKSEEAARRVANHLLDKILFVKSNFKRPNLITWIKEIDRSIRLDKRTEQELIGCIDWIYSKDGEFWMPNILSGKKLREQFDTMEAQMMRTKNKTTTMVDKIYDAGMTAKDMVKEMEKRA